MLTHQFIIFHKRINSKIDDEFPCGFLQFCQKQPQLTIEIVLFASDMIIFLT